MPAEIVTLTCPATGDRARILVSQGFNCFDYSANVGGHALDVLWSLPDFASGQSRASSSGIPLLFPFPGRIRQAQYQWQGRTYALEPGDQQGNAIHGFCHTRPWRVIAQQDDTVTGEFQASRDDPSLLERWPADFRITATYAIGAGVLVCTYTFENPDSRPLPCGFGAHPYFRVPLGGKAANDCIVRLPVTREWELASLLPTGTLRDLPAAAPYQRGVRFGELTLDNAFTGLVFDEDRCAASIHDPGSGRQLTISWDRSFRECIVYTPPHREAICIEPYTCVAGAMELAHRSIDAGLRILAPGESFTARMEIRVGF